MDIYSFVNLYRKENHTNIGKVNNCEHNGEVKSCEWIIMEKTF